MDKLANLKLDGSLEQGVRVVLTIEEHDRIHHEINGSLPPNLSLGTTLEQWQSNYRSLGATRIKPNKITYDASLNQSRLVCQQFDQELRSHFNTWLLSKSFRPIRDRWLEQFMHGEVRVLIRSASSSLLKLPWQLWDLIEQNAQAEVALSTLDTEAIAQAKTPTLREKVRILAILGDSTGIDIQCDRQLLATLADADTTVLVEPQRREINDQLWEQHWDILFFAGHSKTENDRGRIYINSTDSLTISELRYALRNAVDQGLQLAIFNSCDGMGLAFELQQLHIPQTIVMREPVPDRVAQTFLTYFLPAFAKGQSLYLAEREARLRLQGLENEFPGASWLPVLVQNPAAVPPSWQQLGRRSTQYCPYRGLFAFQEADAPFFYGREAFAQTLFAAIAHQSLIAVIGASGSGKSSVVFAGLLPLVRQQHSWQIASFRPGNDPLRSLAAALIATNLTHSSCSISQLTNLLQTEDVALHDVLEAVMTISTEQKLLLVIDQFEELYTHCQNPRPQQLFLDRLLRFTQLDHFAIVITLRSDFLGQVLTHPSFADALQQGNFLLGSMNRAELQAAIESPAEHLGVTLEEGLTERIIQAVGHSASDLPVLEFALQELWAKCRDAQLTHSAYDEIGGVEAAIARYAERVYHQLNGSEKAQAQKILLQLVHLGQGTEETRRLATRREIGEKHWELVTRLASDRLIVTGQEHSTGTETVEIVHEALIREWTRLQQWIDQDRDFRLWQQGLRASLQQWEASDRDEGALLRGKPLTDAEDWLQNRPEELTAEQELITASLALRNREQQQRTRQRRRTIGILTGSLAGALLLAAIAGVGWWRATNAATNERIKTLILESQSLFDLSGAKSFEISKIENKDEQKKDDKKEVLFQEAVFKAIKAGRELQQANGVEPETRFQVLGALRQVIGTKAEPKAFQLSECDKLYRGPVSITWTSDHKTIACVNYDGTVRLWDGSTGKKTNIFRGDSEWVDDVQFSPDGKMVASGTVDGTVKLWDRATGKEIRSLNGHLSQVKLIRFSPNGQTLVAANYDGTLTVWDVATGGEIKTLPGHSDSRYLEVADIVFSPNGQFLVSKGNDNTLKFTLKLWEIATGKELKTIPLEDRLAEILFSPDSQILMYSIGALENQRIRFWSIPENRELRSLSVPGQPFFSPDGKVIAVIDSKPSDLKFTTNPTKDIVSLWDASTGKKVKTLTNLPGVPAKVIFSPDSSVVAVYTYSQDGSPFVSQVKRNGKGTLWNRDGAKLGTLEQLGEFVGITFSPDSRKIAIYSEATEYSRTLGADGRRTMFKLWDVSSGKLLQTLFDEPIQISYKGGLLVGLNSTFSPDGNMIAAASSSGVSMFFDSSTGQELNVPDVSHVRNLDHPPHISKDGKIAITLRTDGSLVARDRVTGKKLTKFNRVESVLSSAVHISDDNKTITTINWYGNLQERELATGRILKSSNFVFDKFTSNLKFSPDGRKVAAARSDYTVKIWDAITSREIITLKKYARVADEGNNWRSNELEFSPDGKLVAALSGEDVFKNGANLELWNVSTGEAIQLSGVPSGVKNISFSPNNDELAILKTDNTIQLWKLSTRQLLKTLRPRLTSLDHIQFNSDNNLLLAWGSASSSTSIGSDHQLKMLSIETEQEVASFTIPSGSFDSANFSSDGKTLVLQGDNQFTFLNFDLEDLLKQNCDIAHEYLRNNPSLSEDNKKLCDFSFKG